MAISVLFDTVSLVVVDKPAGLATIPERHELDCVVSRLARQLGLPCDDDVDPRLRVVHRLDKDTSGVLVFAKTAAAHRHLCGQFEHHTTHKEYLALITGRPANDNGLIDAPLAPHPRRSGCMVISADGKPAQTEWQVEEAFGHYALLRVLPKTGRMHQIRVHLASIGLPLAVDPLYNKLPAAREPGIYLSSVKRSYRRPGDKLERPLIARLTLHAARLAIRDLDETEVVAESPLPKDFQAVLNQLRKWDAL